METESAPGDVEATLHVVAKKVCRGDKMLIQLSLSSYVMKHQKNDFKYCNMCSVDRNEGTCFSFTPPSYIYSSLQCWI